MARAGQCLRARDGRIARRRARSSRAQARRANAAASPRRRFEQVERTTIVALPCGYWSRLAAAGRRRQQRARGRGQGRGQRLGFAAARLWSKSEPPAQRREACSTMAGKQQPECGNPVCSAFALGRTRCGGASDTLTRAAAGSVPDAARHGSAHVQTKRRPQRGASQWSRAAALPRCPLFTSLSVCAANVSARRAWRHAVQVIRTRMGRSGCKRCGRFVAAPPHPRDTVAVARALCTG